MKKRIWIILLSVIITATAYVLFSIRWIDIQEIELVGDYRTDILFHDGNGKGKVVAPWYPVTEHPYTEATINNVRKFVPDLPDLDFDHYFYFVSYGYQILRVQIQSKLETTPSGWKLYLAQAELSTACDWSTVYLYRTPKIPRVWLDIKWYLEYDGSCTIVSESP